MKLEGNVNLFKGRTIAVVNDLTIDEQIYLYEQTRLLKDAVINGKDLSRFKLEDPEYGVYLFFMEDSTRTKESFRNAAKFHNLKVNDFQAQTSSFNKKESITDTVKMLFGYSPKSLFIIRSKLEGVCRWLEDAISTYSEKIGYPRAAFINAGDGKHEHPTQEFLDEFSFLEQKNWDRDHIHVALVGDLFHGRTVHSKADGLGVFNNVYVDLIAPPELAMPDYYIQKMRRNNFNVRIFYSIEEYLSQKDVAEIWYFTRLQLERMGDEILEKAEQLRDAVTFKQDDIERVSKNTRFYHPLPRHREYPTIPSFLDSTFLNGWDLQSINGYYTRIMEIALLTGKIGDDFSGERGQTEDYSDDFVEEAPIVLKEVPEYKVGIKPVEEGIVIDHIAKGQPIKKIWRHVDKIRRILDLNYLSSHGVYQSNKKGLYKGIISLPNILDFDEKQIKMLGAISPGCTINKIKEHRVLEKYRLHMPPRVYNFKEISCKNENCVSRAENSENILPEFLRSGNSSFVCKYCEREHSYKEIWDIPH
ncbi:MAG: aspartate carbamoyltransferase [Spirochaetia bacterium]